MLHLDTENAISTWTTEFNRLYNVQCLFEAGGGGDPLQPAGWNLTYGPDGAVATFDDLDFEWTYVYDDENRLKEVRLGQNVVYSCVYYAFWRPVVETVRQLVERRPFRR